MRIFSLDARFTVVCNTQNTRNGFKHVATLCSNGSEVCGTKICYLNRTWERFEYASVLEQLIDKRFDGAEKEKYLNTIKKLG
jgi:hypothetical protein